MIDDPTPVTVAAPEAVPLPVANAEPVPVTVAEPEAVPSPIEAGAASKKSSSRRTEA
jgi:hypothetical protein